MNEDRTVICNIISKMLDNPDQYGIYPTTEAYDALEKYIKEIRIEGKKYQNKKMLDLYL